MQPVTPTPTVPDTTKYQLAIRRYVSPILKGFMSRFGQGSPYNTYCFTATGERAKVGCVPLAIGTVMGHFEWPKSYNSITFNWSNMKEDANFEDWAHLFEIPGRSENTNANYGVNATGVSWNLGPTLYPRTFENMGYRGAKVAKFDVDVAFSSLGERTPVLIDGLSTSGDGGHMWIIDGGYETVETLPYETLDGVKEKYYHYFHCVWGWFGRGNGYYYLYNNTLGGKPKELDGDTSSPYTFGTLWMTYGYTPNK